MSRLNVCVDMSLDSSGRLIEIDFIACFKLVTGVIGRKKFPVAPAYVIAPFLIVFMIYVDYALSISVGVRLLMIVILSSSLSSLQNSVLNVVFMFYPLLILLNPTVILEKVSFVAAASILLVNHPVRFPELLC